jgi:uncharacterized protein YdeI (YjbR/CyaY-like superfamily)
MLKTLYVTDREAWRKWLVDHHADAAEVWLLCYKKHTGRPSLPYEDSVEEALCFGWIDSLVKRIDDEAYAQKFSPRKSKSSWTEQNIQRVQKLIDEGLMTPAGLAKIDAALLRNTRKSKAPKPAAKKKTGRSFAQKRGRDP